MIKIIQRQLNDNEKKVLKDTKVSQSLNISGNLVNIIGFLFLVPLILGGFIGAILILFGIHENFAYGLGFVIATLYGTFNFFKIHKEDKKLTNMQDKYNKREVAKGVVEIIDIKINKVWEIEDLEDFGPGYLFSVGSNTFVYAATQFFLDINKNKFPTKELIIERLPYSKKILSLVPKGSLIKVSKKSISIKNLPIKTDSHGIPLFKCEIFIDKNLMRK